MEKYFRFLMVIVLIFYLIPAVTSAGSSIPPEYLLNQKASVTLTGLPSGAVVYVDQDKYGGKSPTYPSQSVQLFLNQGKHTLNVQAGGYQPWSQTISVSSGGRITIEVNLIPMPRRTPTTTPPTFQKTPPPTPSLHLGVLSVSLSPSQASLTIDGLPCNKRAPQSLESGTHTLEVKATGYISKTEQIQITRGQNLYLKIALDKDPTTIAPEDLILFEATSHPTGASVYIDGQHNGTTPCTITTSIGQHTVLFQIEGYQDREETMEFYKNAGRSSPQKVFWILTEEGASSAPVQKEAVVRETPRSTSSTTITRASAQSDEPTDVLQYVIYFFRGVFGGGQ